MKISQKILDYAIWYYLRYYPSKKRLDEKLKEKFGVNSQNGKKYGGISSEEVDFIIYEKLRNIINEREVLVAKIKNLKNRGKNLSYIKGNLLRKGFVLSEIKSVLEDNFRVSERSILEKDILKKKIKNYKNKGKSKIFIRHKFIERKLDINLIENLLDEVFFDGEMENLKKEYKKIKDKFERKKIIEKLLRKGFLYNDIKRLIEHY